MKTTTSTTAILFAIENRLTDRQILNRLKKLEELKRVEKETKAAIDAIKADIIGDAQKIDLDTAAFSVKLTPFEKTVFDGKRLKEELPEIYAAYCSTKAESRFTYKIK